MFYYAEIDSEYLVINTHNLTESSTNPNYISITEEQYTNDDLVGKYYNSLSGQFEIIDWDEWVGSSNLFTYYNNTLNCDTEMQLSTKIDNMQAEINSKVGVDHTHDGYVASADLDLLEDIVSTKADASHTHDGYALSNHTHTGYVSQTDFDALSEAIDGKANANHSHSEYASVSHLHEEYASTSHNHNSDYAPLSHSHSNYATNSDLDELSEVVSNKANASHTHDDRYFTETEINSKLATKSDSSHTHTGAYDENGAAANALESANAYTDSKIDALIGEGASTTLDTIGEISSAIVDNQDAIDLLNSAIANKANVADLNAHANDTELHITDVERNSWNAKSNFSGNYNDLTNKPTIPSINGLASEDYVDEAVSTKADSGHTHTIANVSGLQNALNAKSDSTHNHDTSYDTKGSANSALVSAKAYADELIEDEVANRDTAIATAKSSAISTAASDATTKANNALASAKTYADNAAATVKNDLLNGAGVAYDTLKELGDLIDDNVAAIEALEAVAAGKANAVHTHTIANITNLQSTLDGKAASSHTHSNATTSAAGLMSASDKSKLDGIASGANKYTLPTASSTLGGVKTTSTVTNASGYTACPIIGGVPYYKDTNTTYSLSSFGVTATAAELNYVDGVTSNIQTQLNNKAVSGHNHNGVYANTSHTHTASDVGAVAIGDIAIVSEVETYLGI